MQGNNSTMTILINVNKYHNTLIQQSGIVTTHFESKTRTMIDDQPQCTTLLQQWKKKL